MPPQVARALPYLVSGAAGAGLVLAFAPFELFWLAPPAFAVLFYVLRDARPREAFLTGLSFGLGCFGAGTYWTYIAIHDFGGAPIVLAVVVSFALMLVLSLFVALACFAAARFFETNGARAWLVTLPALWVLAEWLRGWAFTGFGWLAAGYSQTNSWLMGYAPVLGLYGASFAVVACGGALLVLALGTLRERVAAVAVLAAAAAGGFASTRHEWTEPKERPVTAALVQGAVSQDTKWRPEMLPGIRDLYSGLTEPLAGTDLIVWPEAAIPDLAENNKRYLASLQLWSEQHGTSLLLGILQLPQAPKSENETFENVLVALTQSRATYVKRHLVPFGEYYPVPGFVRNWLQLLNLPYTDGVPGDAKQPPLDAAGERLAVTICYDDVFGAEQLHYLPDATLLVNVSNDAWFGNSIAPHQHLQIAQMRAAEAGRYLLRATNTGVTAVVDPRGQVVDTMPQFEAGVLKATVRGYTGATPYARWGNYPVIVAAVLLLAVQW
ncbi:MAG TPA: apolipoprotein N-acyltransferase, partial [Gammaproteobacteria bacterium]|nr:apolipoprotein N-acyltransferase [Gammaproteobacteria bacterium]